MKKIDLGQTIGVLANLGVIAGIVFLAVELRQNNELMVAAARDAQNVRIQAYIEQRYMVPELAGIIVKATSGEALTEVEDLKLFSRQLRLLRGFEAQHREYVQGRAEIRPRLWNTLFHEGGLRDPPLINIWDEAKPFMNPDFVRYIEENVISR